MLNSKVIDGIIAGLKETDFEGLDGPVQIGKLVVLARSDIRFIQGKLGREMLHGMDTDMYKTGEDLLAYRLSGGIRTEGVDAIMRLAVPGPHPAIGTRLK